MIEQTVRELIPAELDQVAGGIFNGAGSGSSSSANVLSPNTAAIAASVNSGLQSALGANISFGVAAGVIS